MVLSLEIAHLPKFLVVASRRVHPLATATMICDRKLQNEIGELRANNSEQDSNFPLFPITLPGCVGRYAVNISASEGEIVT